VLGKSSVSSPSLDPHDPESRYYLQPQELESAVTGHVGDGQNSHPGGVALK
jgi:hypothetical protein